MSTVLSLTCAVCYQQCSAAIRGSLYILWCTFCHAEDLAGKDKRDRARGGSLKAGTLRGPVRLCGNPLAMNLRDWARRTPTGTPTRHEQWRTTRNILSRYLVDLQAISEQPGTAANTEYATENPKQGLAAGRRERGEGAGPRRREGCRRGDRERGCSPPLGLPAGRRPARIGGGRDLPGRWCALRVPERRPRYVL